MDPAVAEELDAGTGGSPTAGPIRTPPKAHFTAVKADKEKRAGKPRPVVLTCCLKGRSPDPSRGLGVPTHPSIFPFIDIDADHLDLGAVVGRQQQLLSAVSLR